MRGRRAGAKKHHSAMNDVEENSERWLPPPSPPPLSLSLCFSPYGQSNAIFRAQCLLLPPPSAPYLSAIIRPPVHFTSFILLPARWLIYRGMPGREGGSPPCPCPLPFRCRRIIFAMRRDGRPNCANVVAVAAAAAAA